jgi:NAD(P)-dependent dehydrogenase (short-subunit alcohol dehydrogenase family)
MPPSRPIAVVTGGNRGIGYEVCRQLAEQGYEVILGSRDRTKGEAAARRLGVAWLALDVSEDRSVADAAAEIGRRYGRCDVLVNNAAVDYDTDQRAISADLDRVHRAFETNVFGAWRTTLALLPLIRRSSRGRIVNVSSEGGSLASMSGGTPGYSVGKAALNALTRVLAAELRGDRVLVNAVCPGWTATDMGGGGRPIPDGAASVVWAVTLPDDGPSGGFFRDGRPLPW